MKYLTANRRRHLVFAAFTAFVFLFAAQSTAMAQLKLQPGDEFPIGGGWNYRIVECRTKPGTRLEECDYIPFNDKGATRDILTELVAELRRYIQQNEVEKKRLDIINKSNQTKNQTKPPPADAPAETTEATVPPSEIPSENVEITVTAQQLYTEYGNNKTAAMQQYVGKTVRVTGAFVASISSNRFSAANNKTIRASMIAQCYVEDPEQLATLNKGETVTLVGVVLGNMLSTGVVFEPCRVEHTTAAQAVKPEAVRKPGKSVGIIGGRIAGTWYYTAIIGADGTEKKLSNTASYLWLKDDGSYENRFGTVGQIGTFASSGNTLTLNRENVGAKIYAMTIAGTTMTLKSASGGYRLERE